MVENNVALEQVVVTDAPGIVPNTREGDVVIQVLEDLAAEGATEAKASEVCEVASDGLAYTYE